MVVFNQYAPEGENEMRLMDMSHNKYFDEVIKFVKQKFDKDGEECEIYVVGFSLGGNHSLRYAGSTSKLRMDNEQSLDDQSHHVKAIVAVSNPFDVCQTIIRLQTSHFGIYDAALC